MRAGKLLGGVSLVVLTVYALNLAAQTQSRPAQSPSDSALSDRAKKGKPVFNDYCYRCHEVDSARAKPLGPMGPQLSGLFRREKLIDGKPVTEANVKEFIKMGPTPGMPGFRYTLSDQEVENLIEYLKVK